MPGTVRMRVVKYTSLLFILSGAVALHDPSAGYGNVAANQRRQRSGRWWSQQASGRRVPGLAGESSRRLQSSDLDRHSDGHDQYSTHSTANASLPTHPDFGMDHLFVPLNRSCHPDCTKRGNCNAEEGRCECPFGYTGATCVEPLLPGCQRGPGEPPFFGFLVPRSCECLRQAREFFGCSRDQTCTLHSFYFRDASCYEFAGVPASEQWSRMPELSQPGVTYRRGNIARGMDSLLPMPPWRGAAGMDMWSRAHLNLPLERCGETQCHRRGACMVAVEHDHGKDLEEAAVKQAAESGNPQCHCFKGYGGHTCGEEVLELCPNECRNNGTCIRGFCHCKPPYWGLDCSRERAWQLAPGAASLPNRHVLRIYVYDLPSHVAFPVALDDDTHDMHQQFYQTHRKFLEMLLQDPNVRTENPLEANLFFVPAQAYSYATNTNSPANQISSALRYVAQHYPYFNASGGRDHFVWTTGDRGSCYVHQNSSNVIHVTQFGLHCFLTDNHTTFLRPLPSLHPYWGCYHPKKDVLAAPWYDKEADGHLSRDLYARLFATNGDAPERTLLFFFAGSVRPKDKVYSGGARQALSAHLKALFDAGGQDLSDVRFVEGFISDYAQLHLTSRFCLAPHGAGFGVRLTLAMTHACIPVIIQDQVYQPYEAEGLLPYHEFSLRLSMSDVPHIVPILRGVRPERLRKLRLAMARYYRAFLWEPENGGRAYNYTIRALRLRLHGLWGHLWGEEHEPGTARRRSSSSRLNRRHRLSR